MSQEYKFIEEITPLKENIAIKIRIVRLWKPPSFDNPNEDGGIEMVFLDEKGSKIQASVKKSLLKRFVNLLEEGQLRIITNFGVGQSTGNYKPTQHPYKINFFFTTSVQVCENLPIPLHGFNFVSFDDILSKKLDDKYLVDIIGQVMAVGPVETSEKNGKPSKKFVMELNDNGNGKIKCTLWDKYADEVSNFLTERELSPIIIIIQFAKIKEWKGEIMLTNSLFTDLAELLIKTKLIIWDEAPMIHKYCFEALDRSLRDILRSDKPFGGKTVVFGGDFRQILPVIPKGSRQDIVLSTLISSYLWSFCKVLRLTRNMRLQSECANRDIDEIKKFSEWILQVGDGCIGAESDGEAEIEIPDDILIKDTNDPMGSIVNFTYPSMFENPTNTEYYKERAILCPTNEIVEIVNDYLLRKMDGEEKEYLSSDSISNAVKVQQVMMISILLIF